MPAVAGAGGYEDYDWLTSVFILDSIVGFSWTSALDGNPVGAKWYDQSLFPTLDGRLVTGGAADLGDLTGDGIDDLLVWEDPAQRFILPGPVAQIPNPVLEHPDVIPSPWSPALTRWIPHCGDLNGDGLEDLCSVTEVHLTPFDGVADWTRPSTASDYGLAADMDGDGVNELYIVSEDNVERFTLTPGAGPAVGVFQGTDHDYWVMDLDADGADSLYTPGPGGMQKITAAGFMTNTVQPTSLAFGSPRFLREADFDGDGVLEIYVGFPSGGFIAAQDGTVLLHIAPEGGTPTGTFGSPIDIGDADGNGKDDLLVGGDLLAFFYPNPLDCLP